MGELTYRNEDEGGSRITQNNRAKFNKFIVPEEGRGSAL